MTRAARLLVVLATVLALLGLPVVGAGASPATPPTAGADAPLRVLVVGDSVTQGSAGDWTWRYRLSQHLTADGRAVDLVGPRDDLYDNVADVQGSTAYADPAFDRDHASRWGMTLAFMGDDWPVAKLVEDYRPDVVVEMLGVNDLNFLNHTAARVTDDLRTFVADARSVDPAVDVVLGHLTQTWFDQVPELNADIDALATELDTTGSRVAVAATDVGFEQRVDTWDPAHPNARGEVRIAAAFADALAGLGLAEPYPRPLPEPAPGPGAPSVASAAGDGAVRIAWTRVPGATDDEAQLRDVTTGGPWVVVPPEGGTTAREVTGLVDGHTYGARVRSLKGWAAGDWSPEVRLRPLPPRPGPVRLTSATSPRRDRVEVVGAAVAGATSYRLQVARVRSCAAREAAGARYATRGGAVTRPRVVLQTWADVVRVRLVASNVAGAGVAGGSRCVRVR
ncbi:GDSL-type esterase/lipase family protein [Nocardioides rubriscoriae]|uniref:GDSL-type esterase/lipase family protein n=1 Tax=Nocardioides rubriscoriae TaxID=642762 RepID=UPI0011DF6689|nr:GDSL-type esterase/lipase family protein [Nocardioides rubriscoriae]